LADFDLLGKSVFAELIPTDGVSVRVLLDVVRLLGSMKRDRQQE
jgi:hypothetical protein